MGSVTIIRGEDKTITARIVKNSDQEPFDLTSNTAINAKLKKQDNTTLTVSCSVVGNAVLGKIQFTLTDAQTALLKKGVMSFDVEIDFGTTRRICTFANVLTVQDEFTA